MSIDTQFLDISFDKAGIRNSQKRLKGIITELAVDPIAAYPDKLTGEFELVEEIIAKRVAAVIAYWCQHKHDPVRPSSQDKMSDITNARNSDDTLEEFYTEQVKDALHTLAPTLRLDVPADYVADTDELEYALLELEERFEHTGVTDVRTESVLEETAPAEVPSMGNGNGANSDFDWDDIDDLDDDEDTAAFAQWVTDDAPKRSNGNGTGNRKQTAQAQKETEIVITRNNSELAEAPQQEIRLDVLSLEAEETWRMIYNLMGYHSEYIQEKMLPRWQQNPDTFEGDRRFLYNVFIQAIRNAAGVQYVAGNFTFTGQKMTVDQLWNYYFTDLSQNVGPQLSAARLDAAINDPWYKKAWQTFVKQLRNFSIMWTLALIIALIFDGLTTYVSLDQTPMEGFMVLVFTLLITALFQIADMLVINYRKREFESDALIAKYNAKVEQLAKTLETLAPTSDSYVQLSMEKSQAHADLKASEDNRKLARRGRYWSARIADINIVVTAYGFAFLFLNAEEPMYAVVQQINFIFVDQAWNSVNLWVFLMVGLAITVSFVINTAQRTEILGWSMRRLKNE